MRRRLFCEISPFTYEISLRKEIIKRHIRNIFSKDKIAKRRLDKPLPFIVKSHGSVIVRRLLGVDIGLQENKVTNIELACKKINGTVIYPGETFSFWHIVGPTDKRHGYKEGLVISRHGLSSGYGGGLCQMANMIHWLILNSPLKVTELHHHSDALFPDERRRVPFGTGTSVCYNSLDYRFKNDTDKAVQILVWTKEGELMGELRSEAPFLYKYRLVEEDHHYRKEGEDYYRISKVFRNVIDKETGEVLKKELILDNHSKVMYDHAYIPEDEIRQ